MTKLVKIGLGTLGGVVLLLGGTLVGGAWWLKGRVTPEALVAEMEAAWNVKASVGGTRLDWSTTPARLTVERLDLRLPSEVGNPDASGVKLDEAVLEVRLGALLSRELDVQQLLLKGLVVREYVSPEGVSTLEEMFRKKRDKRGGEAVEGQDAAPVAQTKPDGLEEGKGTEGEVSAGSERKEESAGTQVGVDGDVVVEGRPGGVEHSASFEARELGLTVRIHDARIERGRLYIHNRKVKIKTWMENLDFAVSNIDVDPNDLANHNQVEVSLATALKVEGRAKVAGDMTDVVFCELELEGSGKMQPFNTATGVWDPVSELVLTLGERGMLAGYMTLGEASEDATEKLRQYGLDLSEMLIGGALQEDAVIRMAFHGGEIRFLEDTRFELPEYAFHLQKGSWINSAEDQHELGVKLVSGSVLQSKLEEGMAKQGLGEGLVKTVRETFADPDGRLAFDLRATGQLTRPKIAPAWDKALERLINNGGVQDLLKSLIK